MKTYKKLAEEINWDATAAKPNDWKRKKKRLMGFIPPCSICKGTGDCQACGGHGEIGEEGCVSCEGCATCAACGGSGIAGSVSEAYDAIPEDACDNWTQGEHEEIANHDLDIGKLCCDCAKENGVHPTDCEYC